MAFKLWCKWEIVIGHRWRRRKGRVKERLTFREKRDRDTIRVREKSYKKKKKKKKKILSF
jgi:Zn-finger nucleic acid-binding protein